MCQRKVQPDESTGNMNFRGASVYIEVAEATGRTLRAICIAIAIRASTVPEVMPRLAARVRPRIEFEFSASQPSEVVLVSRYRDGRIVDG